MRKYRKGLGILLVLLITALCISVNMTLSSSGVSYCDTAYLSQGIFSLATHTVTYHTGGGDILEENYIETFTAETPDTLLPIPVRNGYKFDGWYTSSSYLLENKIDRITLGTDEDIDVYAKWSPLNFIIDIRNTDGVSIDAYSKYDSYTSTYDKEYVINITLQDGYQESTGVYLMVGKGEPSERVYSTSVVGDTHTFTIPVILINQGDLVIDIMGVRLDDVTVTYTDGTTTFIDTREYGETYTISSTPFVLGGYTQVAWQIEGILYDFGREINLTSNMTFTPVWQEETYTIVCNLDGGSVTTPIPDTYTVQSNIVIENPTRVGYEFLGWLGSGLSTPQRDLVIREGSYGNKDYVASWRLIHYSISYDLDGGNLTSPVTSFTMLSDDVILPIPSRSGYEFSKWTEDGSTVTKVVRGTTRNISVRANWSIKTYGIEYDTTGGVLDSGAVVNYTIVDEVVLPIPSKEGYVFGGWYRNKSYQGSKLEKISIGSMGEVRLYAHWLKAIVIYEDKDIYASVYNGAGLDQDAILSITRLKNVFDIAKCDEYLKYVPPSRDFNYQIKRVYDINLLKNSAVLEDFSGIYEVKVKLDAPYDLTTSPKVVVIDKSGKVECLEASIVDGYLIFETEHFSRFILVGREVNTLETMQWVMFVIVMMLAIFMLVLGVVFVYHYNKSWFVKICNYISKDFYK